MKPILDELAELDELLQTLYKPVVERKKFNSERFWNIFTGVSMFSFGGFLLMPIIIRSPTSVVVGIIGAFISCVCFMFGFGELEQ